MPTRTSTLLVDLIVAATRLTRLAAQTTGTTTPAAVWRTLSILETDGSLRIGDLAKTSRVSQPTMTKLIQNLAEEQLIYRIADAQDSRAWLIAITPKGTIALVAWRRQLGEALAPLFADLSPSDAATLEKAVAIVESRTNVPRNASTPSAESAPSQMERQDA